MKKCLSLKVTSGNMRKRIEGHLKMERNKKLTVMLTEEEITKLKKKA